MTVEIRCPHCTHALQAQRVTSPVGAEVELGNCPHCSKVWAPGGHVQRSFGAKALHHLVGGTTQHSCVECRILLTPALLGSGATVEVCSACHGLLIDETELAALGIPRQASVRTPPPVRAPPPVWTAPPVPVPARESEVVELHEEDEITPVPSVPVYRLPTEPPAPPRIEAFTAPQGTSGTFGCVLCQQLKPLREGQAFRDGLACRSCLEARARG